jgi:hypothetical protein
LSLRGGLWIDVEAVLNQLPGHSWHVRWLPREDVAVSPKEADERVFLFGVEVGPDGGGLAGVACSEVDRPDEYLLRWLRLVGAVRLLRTMSYGPPWAHYIGGYQDRLLGGPLGLPGLRCTAPEGVEHKDYTGVVLG